MKHSLPPPALTSTCRRTYLTDNGRGQCVFLFTYVLGGTPERAQQQDAVPCIYKPVLSSAYHSTVNGSLCRS